MEDVDFAVVGKKMPMGTQICEKILPILENAVICVGRSS